MKKSSVFTGIACIVLGQFAASAQGEDATNYWPNFRGPLAAGVAPNAEPPVRWSETENIKWKFKLPAEGLSSPVVWGNKVFITVAIPAGRPAESAPAVASPALAGDDVAPGRRGGRGGRGGGFGGRGGGAPTDTYQFAVLCLDRNNGNLLWQKIARETVPHEGHQPSNRYASASPVTDGKQLYVSFGSWGVYCYDLDGNLKWERDFGQMQTPFGEGTSPVVYEDHLIINWDHNGDDFIAALDTRSGETRWKTEREERTTWVTPAVIAGDNLTQVIVPAPSNTRSYNLATGELIWECGGQARGNVVPTPVVGFGYVFVMSGHQGNSVQAIRYDRTGDITGSDAVGWSLDRNAPHVPSPLLYDGLLYFLSNNNAVLSCYDAASGKAHYQAERIEGLRDLYSSPVGAAGRVYFLSRDGSMAVLRNSPDFELLALNRIPDQFGATPAIAGNEMFLRGYEYLYCIAEP